MTSWYEPRFNRARQHAHAIIKELQLEEPDELDVEAIAAMRGVAVTEKPLRGCEGRLVRTGSTGYITIDSGIRELGRKRFAIAHELGHFELHGDLGQSQVALFHDEKLSYYFYKRVRPEEEEANAFASELLMPEFMFTPRCQRVDPSLGLVEELSRVFATSLTATAIRYPPVSPHDCVLIYSREGDRKWFVASEDFPLRVCLGPVEPTSIAWSILRGNTNPERMTTSPAGAWFTGKSVDHLLTVREDSRLLRRYNAMLTLVWLDQEVDAETWYSD